jgi:hypothetical protein
MFDVSLYDHQNLLYTAFFRTINSFPDTPMGWFNNIIIIIITQAGIHAKHEAHYQRHT